MLYTHRIAFECFLYMNLRAAKNELREPPRIGLPWLVAEAVAVIGVSYLLVGLIY